MAVRWRVINDTPRDELMPDMGFIPVREVTFELLDTGRKGKVIIPLRNYTADFVASEITRYAETIDAVANLTTE
jgi:hypothetical protein